MHKVASDNRIVGKKNKVRAWRITRMSISVTGHGTTLSGGDHLETGSEPCECLGGSP